MQIPSAPLKLLIGSDNLDTWKEQTWEAILDGTSIVVSTFQVLLDALDTAFVRMERLALLVIDEGKCDGHHTLLT